MDEVAKKREIERLLQVRRIQVIEKPTDQAFVCVYSLESLRDGFHCFSYLFPLDQKDQFLSDVGWNLRNDNFRTKCAVRGRLRWRDSAKTSVLHALW